MVFNGRTESLWPVKRCHTVERLRMRPLWFEDLPWRACWQLDQCQRLRLPSTQRPIEDVSMCTTKREEPPSQEQVVAEEVKSCEEQHRSMLLERDEQCSLETEESVRIARRAFSCTNAWCPSMKKSWYASPNNAAKNAQCIHMGHGRHLNSNYYPASRNRNLRYMI